MNDVTVRFIEVYNYLLSILVIAGPKDFAEKIGVSTSMITEIIKGRSNVGVKAIQNTVNTFSVSPFYLFSGEGKMLLEKSISKSISSNISLSAKNAGLNADPSSKNAQVNAQVNAQALKKNASEDDKILCKENAYPDAYLTEKGVNLSSEENGQVLEKNITESITQSIAEVEMLRKDADLTEKSNEQTPLRIEPSKMSSFAVPFYDIPVSAGPLGVLTYSREAMQPDGYIDMEIFRRCEAILPVVGVSMEPEIHSGDLIGIRKLEHYSWEYIETGKVYMIITQEDRMIKYINKADDSDYIICSSPNYHDFKIRKADVLEIYRVIANIRVL